MRDLALTMVVFGLIPFILSRTYVGVLVWSWLGYMNPHRLAYGFAHDFQFSLIVAAVTFVSLLFNREPKRVPNYPLTYLWMIFVIWMCVTAFFALAPASAYEEWMRMLKIQIMVLLTLMLITDRYRLNALVWVITFSIGFYGIKGGLFSVATGGSYIVWGPEDSFIEGNNELALALVMIMPLMWYLRTLVKNSSGRMLILLCIALSMAAAIFTYSRGAFLAISAITAFLAWKIRIKGGAVWKVFILFFLGIALTVAIPFMPGKWFERMSTIQSYEQDASAVGRLQAWNFAINMASSRVLTGGGFGAYKRDIFREYNTTNYILPDGIDPSQTDFHDAHSIYFEVLGEQGFIGLLLFLSLLAGIFIYGMRIEYLTHNRPELSWAYDLAGMIQVSTLGYAVGGAFLGLAYFDLPYHMLAIILIVRMLVEKELGTYGVTSTFADSIRRSSVVATPINKAKL